MHFTLNSERAQWSALATAFAILAAVLAWQSVSSFRATRVLELERLATQARVVDENLSKQLTATHLVLDSIRRDLPAMSRSGGAAAAVTDRLHAMREAMPGIRALTLFDAGGTIVARSPNQFVGQNFARRDYFRIAREGGKIEPLYIAPPFLAATGEYVVNVVRVLVNGRGDFDGIVLASLSPDYFRTLLESVRYAPDMWMAIAHGDGHIFQTTIGEPDREAAHLDQLFPSIATHRVNGDRTSTNFNAIGPGGTPSVTALRSVRPTAVPLDKPLLLIAARPRDGVLGAWQRNAAENMLLFALLLSVAALALHSYQRRQRAYEALLAAREAERRQAETNLRIAAAAFNSQEDMLVTDSRGIILMVNQALVDHTGYDATELVGQTPRILRSGQHDDAFYEGMWEAIRRDGGWQGEVWNRRKNGEIYPKWVTITAVRDARGEVTHYVSAQTDITERKVAEDRIRNLAFHDQLTGLPNRVLLLDRIEQAIATGSRSKSHGAVLLIDLDNFKQINDTQGHDAGDLLLRQVAQRLALCVRDEDTVGRIGGDEFVVLLSGLGEEVTVAAKNTEQIAEKIAAALTQPFTVGNQQHACTASIGVALFLGPGVSVDELMKQADLTMYKAKSSGRNTVRFFDPEMEVAVIRRATLEGALRDAVRDGQFELVYQPQVTRDERVVGAEALLRWRHPARGLVSPCEFIPLAEETGLILPLGDWVLDAACRQMARWAKEPALAHLTVAVNVSAVQFRDDDFVDRILSIVQRTGADPTRLKLELTESVLVDNVQGVMDRMFALRARGIAFSLDDFGTGYSSMTYLRRLPLEQLKIDRSFVSDVLVDPNDAAIARTIIGLGQSLGLGVIAEGVELKAQRDFLADAGCLVYQGYYFSRPLAAADIEAYVSAQGSG